MEKITNKYDKQILLYLNKLMDPDQVKMFENEMKANIDLANEVKAQQFERAFDFMVLKADLRESYVKIKEEEDSIIIIVLRNPFVRIAASLLILIGSFVLYQNWNTPAIPPHKDITKSFSPKVNDLLVAFIQDSKQPKEGVPAALEQATLAYERGEYEKASRLLAKPITKHNNNSDNYGASKGNTPDVTKPDPTTESYRVLYQGLVLLSNNQIDKALTTFKTVGKPLEYEAQWYSALAYLKKKDVAKGREILEKVIADANDTYKADAQKLLDSLR